MELGALDKEVVGLDVAKSAIRDVMSVILNTPEAERLRLYSAAPPAGVLLYGPPGTGKSSFAPAVAREFGCVFVAVNASLVVGRYMGEAEQNIRQVFAWARHYARHGPVVVFWDEFDAIAGERGSGNLAYASAVGALLTEMDSIRGSQNVVVIAATSRVDRLDKALLRPGRFDVKIQLDLPNERERAELFRRCLSGKPTVLSEAEVLGLGAATGGLSPAEIEAVCGEAARRAAREGVEIALRHVEEALRSVTGKGGERRRAEEVWVEIDSLIGLERVKAALREIEAVVMASRERRARGLPPLCQTLHMVFFGNPGTGKTTVARLVGELFAALGVLPSGQLVETDRSGLVAGYVGQTALKTQEKLKEALGGVLFVDEAYSLARGAGAKYDFGAEALDALIKAMEDYRERLCVILAGYTEEMRALLKMNPGLESRIAFTLEFPDYTPEELVEIARLYAGKRGWRFGPGVGQRLLEVFECTIDRIGELGNGRFARNLVELAERKAAVRIARGGGDLDVLLMEDFGEITV
ncbi:MAG: AAA family ATPase [Bacillota bacterium]|nr:AAA family ATPase [Bacillota bacterium]MDI7248851.1 AAA family ATPase [Bacillota bacterium]